MVKSHTSMQFDVYAKQTYLNEFDLWLINVDTFRHTFIVILSSIVLILLINWRNLHHHYLVTHYQNS